MIYTAAKTSAMTSESFIVKGGNTLSGTITPQGAKNEALQILCAVLLTSEEVEIHNIPDILDVQRLIQLIDGLGVQVERIDKNSYRFKADQVDLDYCGTEEFQSNARKIRGSVMLIGPMLARFHKAFLPKPGGDKIGRRRLDAHFHGFKDLGAEFKYDEKADNYYVAAEHLKGTNIWMDEISVTGTANVVMASSTCGGINRNL